MEPLARRRKPAVISLFSGALGLDLGLERAGFEVRVAVEANRFAAETIRCNRPDLPVIQKKIESVTAGEILRWAGLRVGEAALLTGGPSCQSFSTAGQRGSLSDPRGSMFRQFLRVVREARPRFFIMENVCGVLSAAAGTRDGGGRSDAQPRLARRRSVAEDRNDSRG
jgi:DNA (cytosine-5)-methyltransferase 1